MLLNLLLESLSFRRECAFLEKDILNWDCQFGKSFTIFFVSSRFLLTASGSFWFAVIDLFFGMASTAVCFVMMLHWVELKIKKAYRFTCFLLPCISLFPPDCKVIGFVTNFWNRSLSYLLILSLNLIDNLLRIRKSFQINLRYIMLIYWLTHCKN